ncbi:hypothetical protein AAFF_G00144780 [Aldrovandia affinis]|uniref:G-protein coupled receptors family 1 profile domain-containing protein n=1 Tax=Aldrovandia affinis TaxID=143900 RepID=A0AAD7WWJ3_9TELE|nr:hypothetical protein AAFF_G00144780 [Aldrovandia affinis]
MIPLFTFVFLLIGASEPQNAMQINGPRYVQLTSAETTPKKLESVTFKVAHGLNPEISLIQSDAEDLSEDDPSPSKSDTNQKRVPRGASDGSTKQRDQHSPFSHRYPRPYESNNYFTTPKSIQRPNSTFSLDRGSGTARGLIREDGARNNNSAEKGTGIHNPLYPVTDSSYSAYAVMLLSLIVFAVGITGNLAVMCIVWHNYYMKSAWNSILASLAFWDFLVLFFCLPLVVFNEITKKRLLGDVSCRIVPYMEVTSLGVTTFSLCALGIDRFHAATSLQPKTQHIEQCQSILAKLAVVWIGSMILAVPELLLWQLSQDTSGVAGIVVDSCTMRPSPSLPESVYSLVHTYHDARMWWYFGCYFCLPLLFTLSCQLVTRRIGGGATRDLEPCPLPSTSSSSSTSSSPKKLKQEKHEQRRDRQLNRTVVALAMVYAICGLPENACNIALAYTATQLAAPTLSLLALINQFFLFFKSSVTPVLLLCLCKSLGQSFMDCCCCCCEECQSDEASSASTSSSSPSSACRTAGGKPKATASEMSSSIFFDKAKDSSSILPIGTPC